MIKGKRVYFKAISNDDITFMLSLLNDFEISYYEGKNEFLLNELEQVKWLESKSSEKLAYLIYDENNNKIGYMSFKFVNKFSRVGRIGIKLHPDFRGKGYATDSLKTLSSYLFSVFNLNKLETHIASYNKSSLALFKKSNWCQEGILRKNLYMGGKYSDNILWGLLKEEFIADQSNIQYLNLFNLES